jgi:hypothetical protein
MVVKWNLKSVEKPQDNIAINYVLTIKKDGFERKVKGSGQLVDEKKIEGLLPGSSYSIIMEAGEVGKTNTFESSAEVAKTLAQADFTEYPMIAFSDQGMQISFKTNLACQSAIAIRPKGSAGFVQIANGTISNDHTHTITQELEFVSKDGAKVAEIKINLMVPAKSTVVKSMTFYLGGKLANLNGLSKKDKKELAVQAEKVGTVVGAGMKGLLKILVPVVP